ncbi:MAG: hypothetical protein H6813_05260 [Phycisphaeraceae bacterium]|nr:hypothetical protein [Phycisphaeraceae bacterium]MCB9847792.1 hypothetical protein [Phycisphaeraceae bacterium]
MKLSTRIVLASAVLAAPLAMGAPIMSQFSVPPTYDTKDNVARGLTDHRAEARFASTTSLASGKAKYREKSNGTVIQQRFSVEVEDATPGDTLTVLVNGNMYGSVVVNDLGGAELQFRTAEFIDDPGDGDPIPTEFPRINPGDSISVGDMSATFN